MYFRLMFCYQSSHRRFMETNALPCKSKVCWQLPFAIWQS